MTPRRADTLVRMPRSPLSQGALWVALAAAMLGGCGAEGVGRGGGEPDGAAAGGALGTSGEGEGGAMAAVEARILPLPSLPATRPAATGRSSLEAIHLYGRAYADLLAGRRLTAVGLLEQAMRADPDSAAVRQLLAQALLESAGGSASAGQQLERALVTLRGAAELEPDHLETWFRIGRIHTAREEFEAALLAFRTATLTSEYRSDRARAALVDLHLARAFDRLGYTEAAVGRYQRMLAVVMEIQSGRMMVPRDLLELRLVLQREDLLFGEVGAAFERAGRWSDAADLYALAAARNPGAIEAHTRWARALVAAGRREEAIEVAGRLVSATRATPAAVDLLMEVAGGGKAAIAELSRQADQAPDQAALQRALIAAYRQMGEVEEAFRRAKVAVTPSVLEGAPDRALLRSLLELSLELNRPAEGAALLVSAMAKCRRADPSVVAELVHVLTAPAQRHRLRLSDLAGLPVEPSEVVVRDYLVAVAAEPLGRVEWSRSLLREAAGRFVPAVLMWAQDLMAREDLSAGAREREQERLLKAARSAGGEGGPAGGAALELAVSGWLMLSPTGSAVTAVRQLAEAREAGVQDPYTAVALAEGLRRINETQRLDAWLTRIAVEFPDSAAVQVVAVRHLVATGRVALAEQRLAIWTALEPDAPEVQSLSIALALDVRRDLPAAARLAESALTPFVTRETLQTVERAMTTAQRQERFLSLLESVQTSSPRSIPVTRRWLIELTRQGRVDAAQETLARAVADSGDDPDLLYTLSGIAFALNFGSLSDELLERVLRADPHHAGAANDLAYHLAERPQVEVAVLERALGLARLAVAREPEVAAYLDTLGWVHYRRGEYEQAREFLQAAAELMADVEPVIADHLGDTLWRLGEAGEARRWWRYVVEHSADDEREDTSQLGKRVRAKLDRPDAPPVAPSLRHP